MGAQSDVQVFADGSSFQMRMPSYRVLLTLGAAALASVLAFRILGYPGARKCPPTMSDLRAMDLRGWWTVEVTPDSARQLPYARLGRRLRRSFRLISRDSSSSGVVYTGEYSADFQSVGLFKKSGEVLAFTPPGDTLRVILDPTVDHGHLELVARCRSGELRGKWIQYGDPSIAWGHFVMR
jgi:hypothetical protein